MTAKEKTKLFLMPWARHDSVGTLALYGGAQGRDLVSTCLSMH